MRIGNLKKLLIDNKHILLFFMIEINFDGACGPFNPGGTASYGYVIKRSGKVLVKNSKIIGSGDGMTNNVAEYIGLLEAIKAIYQLHIEKEKVIIHGDSNLVCYTIGKKWGWKNKKKGIWDPHKNFPHLKAIVDQIMPLLKNLDYVIKWIPREENQEADDLSKKPLIEAGIIKEKNNCSYSNRKLIKKSEKSRGEQCPKCSGYLKERTGKFGKFFGCSNYPKCDFTKSIKIQGMLPL